MQLILTRHGQTVEAENGLYLGQSQGTLSSKGEEEAKLLGEVLKDLAIDIIYSSDLNRCKQTTDIINRVLPNVEIVYTGKLKERYMGKYEMKPAVQIDWENLPDDVESSKDLEDRVVKYINSLLIKHNNQRVLFVASSGVIASLIANVMGITSDDFFSMNNISNCSLTEIHYDDKGKGKLLYMDHSDFLIY